MTTLNTATRLTHTAATRSFGVEIECLIPMERAADFECGGYHHGVQTVNAPRGWNCQRDCSVGGLNGYVPVEVVSPVLCGEEGLVEVVYMLDYLHSVGATVNDSCGLHVHVDARDMTDAEVTELRWVFEVFEMAFYGMAGADIALRLNSRYCMPVARATEDTRYRSLNLTNLQYRSKRTVEVRCFAGTLDADAVVAAIYMAVAVVIMAKANATGLNANTCVRVATETLEAAGLDIENDRPDAVMMSLMAVMFAHPDFQIVADDDATDIRAAMLTRSIKATRALRPSRQRRAA